MPKDITIQSILVIGSGQLSSVRQQNLIMQEHKLAMALKEEGYKVFLVNDNPATIMTDKLCRSNLF